MIPRCPECFRRLDPNPHVVHICEAVPRKPKPKKPKRPTKTARPPREPKAPQRSRSEYLADVASAHGTKRRYQQHKCRCDPCRAANYAEVKAWRARKRGAA